MRNELSYVDQLILEEVFDKNWAKGKEYNLEKIKKAVSSGDEKFLDKVGRILLSRQYLIMLIGMGPGAAGSIVGMVAGTFGAALGALIGGLFADAVMDKSKFIMMTDYKFLIVQDIKTIETQKKIWIKGNDTEKIANADKVLASLRKTEAMLDKKIQASVNKVKKESMNICSVEFTKNIFTETKLR